MIVCLISAKSRKDWPFSWRCVVSGSGAVASRIALVIVYSCDAIVLFDRQVQLFEHRLHVFS